MRSTIYIERWKKSSQSHRSWRCVACDYQNFAQCNNSSKKNHSGQWCNCEGLNERIGFGQNLAWCPKEQSSRSLPPVAVVVVNHPDTKPFITGSVENPGMVLYIIDSSVLLTAHLDCWGNTVDQHSAHFYANETLKPENGWFYGFSNPVNGYCLLPRFFTPKENCFLPRQNPVEITLGIRQLPELFDFQVFNNQRVLVSGFLQEILTRIFRYLILRSKTLNYCLLPRFFTSYKKSFQSRKSFWK